MRLLKCYGTCGQKYPKDEMVQYKNQNHCKECAEQKEQETADREKLYDYLKKTFNINFPTGLMLRQIKQYKEERGYCYKNIYFAVDYIVRIKKIELQTKFGIALVPHIYDEMIEYYKDLKRKRENNVVKETVVKKIVLKPKPIDTTYRQKKLINMED